jgi:hypothetical protein
MIDEVQTARALERFARNAIEMRRRAGLSQSDVGLRAGVHRTEVRRMWIALRRQGEEGGRGRVQRLMKAAGIQSAKRRGKAWRTTTSDPQAHRRPDLVERDFSARRPTASGSGTSPISASGRAPRSSPS